MQVFFASMSVVGKLALRGLPGEGIVLVRVAGGAICFYAMARSRGSLELRLTRRDVPLLVGASILGVAANQLLFIHGLHLTTAVNASVIGTSVPIFTVGIAALLGKEPLRPQRLAGIALGLAGTLILVRVDAFRWSDATAVGNVYIVANSLCYATFLVVVRGLAPRAAPLALVTLLFAVSLPVVLPFGVRAWAHLGRPLTGADVAFLAYFVAIPTVGAYALNQMALARAESSLVAAYIYLQPLVATTGAMIFLGERPGPRTAAGGALIVAGLFASTYRPRTEARVSGRP